MKPPPEKGTRFGRLVVLKEAVRVKDRRGRTVRKLTCQCDCGRVKDVLMFNVIKGDTKSCGCLGRELSSERCAIKVEGIKSTEHPLYKTWNSMVRRCYCPTEKDFPRYGGRGIGVCEKWKNSFGVFVNDMGPRPEGTTLDRINNDGEYSPDNCRWASPKQQQNNRRSNKRISFSGESMTIAQWARRIGMSRHALMERLKTGWSVERALTEPLRPHVRKR